MNAAELLKDARELHSAAWVLARDDSAFTQATRIIGRGLAEAISVWEFSGWSYLVLVAPAITKLRDNMPLMLPARNSAELQGMVFYACDRLSGKTCAWDFSSLVADQVLPIVRATCGQAGNA